MSWTTNSPNSRVFGYAVLDVLANNTNPHSNAYSVALYSNTITPDATVTTAAATTWTNSGGSGQWCAATGGEVPNGSGYTTGGVSVSSPQTAQNYNSQGGAVVAFYSGGSPQWTSASFTTYGCLVYNTSSSNKGLCYNYFGGAQTVSGSGTLTLTWAANGICTFSC